MEKRHPGREECLELLKQHKTPAHVVNHCIAVTDTALKIAGALNEHGYQLDLNLIQGAALIHDIARVEEEHWEVGSRIAEHLGYEDEAKIIRVHMRYSPFSSIENINETDLVCLGDRLVREDQYVGLEKRMNYIIEKARAQGHFDAIKRIEEKKNETAALIQDIEKVIGLSLDQLMSDNEKGCR